LTLNVACVLGTYPVVHRYTRHRHNHKEINYEIALLYLVNNKYVLSKRVLKYRIVYDCYRVKTNHYINRHKLDF